MRNVIVAVFSATDGPGWDKHVIMDDPTVL
jgi:hypothetical protein